MVNVSKIRKHSLEQETIELDRMGLSTHDVAKELKMRHPDIVDLRNLSAMAVWRFLEENKVKEKEYAILDGDDVESALRQEFRDKMHDLDDDTHEIYIIMKKALKQVVKSGTDTQIIRAAKDILYSMEQTRKNWTSLVQFGVKQLGQESKARENITINIDKQLISLSSKLCSKCRSKVVGLVLTEEEEDARI